MAAPRLGERDFASADSGELTIRRRATDRDDLRRITDPRGVMRATRERERENDGAKAHYLILPRPDPSAAPVTTYRGAMDFRDGCEAGGVVEDASYCVPVAGGTLGRLPAWWRLTRIACVLLVCACLAYPLAIDDPITLLVTELATVAMMVGAKRAFLLARSRFVWPRLAARVASHANSRVVFVAITITHHERRDEDIAVGTFDLDRYSVAIEGLRYRYQIQRRDLISFGREQLGPGHASVLRYRIADRKLALVLTYLSPRRGRLFEAAAALALCPDRLADHTYAKASAPHTPADDRAARRIAGASRPRWSPPTSSVPS